MPLQRRPFSTQLASQQEGGCETSGLDTLAFQSWLWGFINQASAGGIKHSDWNANYGIQFINFNEQTTFDQQVNLATPLMARNIRDASYEFHTKRDAWAQVATHVWFETNEGPISRSGSSPSLSTEYAGDWNTAYCLFWYHP